MSTGLLLQYLVISLAVLVSAWVVVTKQFPGLTRRLRTRVALWLLRGTPTPAARALARRLAPAGTAVSSACGGCSSCDTRR